MILDLFIYIIQFYINQNIFLPGFIIRKRKRISIDDSILSKIEYNTINVLVGKNGSGKCMSLEYINTQLPDSVMLPENYHLMDVSKKENICLNQDIDYDNSFLEDIPNEHVEMPLYLEVNNLGWY